MKVLKVKLHHIDKGKCIEVWSVKPKKGGARLYVARRTYGTHEWYWLSDAPYGYCECDYPCSPEIIFTVCNKYWHQLLRDGNDRTRFPNSFPTLEESCCMAWENIEKNQYITRTGFGEWILKQAIVLLRTSTDEQNWKDSFQDIVKVETLSRFKFLNRRKAVYRITKQHAKCGATWCEYFAGDFPYSESGSMDKFFAYEYRDKHIREILEILSKRCNDFKLAEVQTTYGKGYIYHTFMGELVGHNLSFDEILDVKDRNMRSAADSYMEAVAYFNALENSGERSGNIDSLLFDIRERIARAKTLKSI